MSLTKLIKDIRLSPYRFKEFCYTSRNDALKLECSFDEIKNEIIKENLIRLYYNINKIITKDNMSTKNTMIRKNCIKCIYGEIHKDFCIKNGDYKKLIETKYKDEFDSILLYKSNMLFNYIYNI